MKTSLRNKLNRAIGSAIKPYSSSIPIQSILDVVEARGFQAVCEDGSPFSAIFCGHNGTCSIEIIEKATGKKQSEAIQLQWWGEREHGHKGLIEINCYVF